MTATILFANYANSSLAGNISNVATTLNVQAGAGALFPNPGANQWFFATITDAATRTLHEIIQVTARATDAFTIVRAQEGTTALAWIANDLIAVGNTAGIMAASQNLVSVVGETRSFVATVSAAGTALPCSADEVIVQTSLGGQCYSIPAFSESLNISTTGAGGMDTGSPPVSGYIAAYAIYNPLTNTASVLGMNATSSIAPNIYAGGHMPAGYIASALISVWPTNGSSQLVIGFQRGRKISIATAQALVTSTPTTITTLGISAIVPPNAVSVFGYMTGYSTMASSGAVGVYPNISAVGGQICTFGVAANEGTCANFEVDIALQQNLYYTLANSAGTPTVGIQVTGYRI